MGTTVVQILGSPASGKSTAALGLCTKLKCMGVDAILSLEYIKPLIYKGIKITPYTQYHIFGHEVEQEATLFNKVSCVISDSSPLLATFYQWYYNKNDTLKEACYDFYKKAEEKDGVKFINFLLPHREEYSEGGRFQNKEESIEIEGLLKTYLRLNGYSYIYLDCTDDQRIDRILQHLKEEGVINE